MIVNPVKCSGKHIAESILSAQGIEIPVAQLAFQESAKLFNLDLIGERYLQGNKTFH